MSLIKLREDWYTINELKDFIELLENQETTDKHKPGEYVLDGIYNYKIDDENDIIMEVLQWGFMAQ